MVVFVIIIHIIDVTFFKSDHEETTADFSCDCGVKANKNKIQRNVSLDKKNKFSILPFIYRLEILPLFPGLLRLRAVCQMCLDLEQQEGYAKELSLLRNIYSTPP